MRILPYILVVASRQLHIPARPAMPGAAATRPAGGHPLPPLLVNPTSTSFLIDRSSPRLPLRRIDKARFGPRLAGRLRAILLPSVSWNFRSVRI